MEPILTRHLSLGLTCAIAAGALVSLSNSRARRMTSARARASPLAAAAGADGFSEAMPAADPRLGRPTVLTLPLLPPPQKN
jgi:hypothetical protein